MKINQCFVFSNSYTIHLFDMIFSPFLIYDLVLSKSIDLSKSVHLFVIRNSPVSFQYRYQVFLLIINSHLCWDLSLSLDTRLNHPIQYSVLRHRKFQNQGLQTPLSQKTQSHHYLSHF